MKMTVLFLLLAALNAGAASRNSEFETGREFYTKGNFAKAAAHFQLALQTSPDGAETSYWIGMSYERMADIAIPFGGKYNSKAREYLTKAWKLAPGDHTFRMALFGSLLDIGSRTALRDAADILLTMSESDPDYSDMRSRLDFERRAHSSTNARLGRLFLAVPRATYRIAALPASALSSKPSGASLAACEQ